MKPALVTIIGLAAFATGCSTAQRPAVPRDATPTFAGIAGTWHFEAMTPVGHQEAVMYVVQDGRNISGRFEGELGVMNYVGIVEPTPSSFITWPWPV